MAISLAPYVTVERIQGHANVDGGRYAGPPYDLVQVYVRISSSCWIMVASAPTSGDGFQLPVRVRG